MDRLTQLIHNLTESLSVEVKQWIDLETNLGKAKVVKATLALRNYNGGEFSHWL